MRTSEQSRDDRAVLSYHPVCYPSRSKANETIIAARPHLQRSLGRLRALTISSFTTNQASERYSANILCVVDRCARTRQEPFAYLSRNTINEELLLLLLLPLFYRGQYAPLQPRKVKNHCMLAHVCNALMIVSYILPLQQRRHKLLLHVHLSSSRKEHVE